jgi:hypothetical protein
VSRKSDQLGKAGFPKLILRLPAATLDPCKPPGNGCFRVHELFSKKISMMCIHEISSIEILHPFASGEAEQPSKTVCTASIL